jgi:phosphopantetheinyl transferase
VGHLSKTVKTEFFPITLSPPPFFQDHHVDNRPVLAAVEAMQQLVADTCGRFPEKDGRRLADIHFNKFLHLDTQHPLTAINQVAHAGDGSLRATLSTRFTSPQAKISRTVEHVSLVIGRDDPSVPETPLDAAAALSGVCTAVEPDRIYRELVPFGPAYRNICETLLLSTDGALARVRSPRPPDPRSDLCLGSPYVLDAAFHAACVWCQRFCGIVAFPVYMHRRTIIQPTRMNEVYSVRVVPVQTGNAPFVFDIFVYDDTGALRESASGVHMRDVSGGRVVPPQGFRQTTPADTLTAFHSRVSAMVVLERRAVADFAAAALSGNETQRLTPMAPDRAKGYLSARLALKRLSRRLSGDGDRRQSREIETVAVNDPSPRCPLADGTLPFCAVSHDRRFTIAVAADRPVGVDVEPLSEKPLNAIHLYMGGDEQAVVRRSTLGLAEAALRVWSTKEAAAKALGINLAESWATLRVIDVAAASSQLVTTGGKQLTAIHAPIDEHLFTLLNADGLP